MKKPDPALLILLPIKDCAWIFLAATRAEADAHVGIVVYGGYSSVLWTIAAHTLSE